jgi:hypothetical protein
MTIKELEKELKHIRGMAKCLNVLAKEVGVRGKFDEDDMDLLVKIGTSILWKGKVLEWTE